MVGEMAAVFAAMSRVILHRVPSVAFQTTVEIVMQMTLAGRVMS
jgi:hypothetical protein